jgi:exopolysaccharide biosynthesis polyprenyl glycosylphosphotransferase
MPFSLRFTERRTLLIIVDLVLVNLTTLLALWIMAARAGWPFDRAYLMDQSGWFFVLSALWLFSALLNGFYDPQKITDLASAAGALLRVILLVTVIYFAIYFFFATPGSLPRGIVGYQGAMSFLLIGLSRVLYVSLLQQPSFARRVIIVGAGWAGLTIAEAIQHYAWAHYQILGFVDDDANKRGKRIPSDSKSSGPYNGFGPVAASSAQQLSVLGASCDLLCLVKEHNVPEIILAITHNISTPLFQALLDCKEQGVQITLMPVLFEQLTGQVPIEHVGDHWNIALPLDSAEASGFYPVFKRAFDIIGALIGLLLFSVLLPFIALAIHLDSAGAIFYSQERVGKGGRAFKLLKLRTMIANAEEDGHAQRAKANDARITRVGRMLRKMRLDEMPQLVNILKGEMSAVGPRPERPEHLAELDRTIPFHRLRNAVKPGMAGWAVINYDYVESLTDAKIRLQYDLYYIKHQSLWIDLLILLRTMGHMLALRGR